MLPGRLIHLICHAGWGPHSWPKHVPKPHLDTHFLRLLPGTCCQAHPRSGGRGRVRSVRALSEGRRGMVLTKEEARSRAGRGQAHPVMPVAGSTQPQPVWSRDRSLEDPCIRRKWAKLQIPSALSHWLGASQEDGGLLSDTTENLTGGHSAPRSPHSRVAPPFFWREAGVPGLGGRHAAPPRS